MTALMRLIRRKKRLLPTSSQLVKNPESYFEKVGLQRLNAEQAKVIRRESAKSIERRLKANLSYPTYTRGVLDNSLSRSEGHKTIAVEIGGTNMRAALFEVRGGVLEIIDRPMRGKLADDNGNERTVFGNTDDFFDCLFGALPQLFEVIKVNPGATLSVVFSFPGQPIESDGNLDYKVGRLTKGFNIPGIEGSYFVPLLNAYLSKRDIEGVMKVALFNDSAILAKDIGLVIGTGYNFSKRMSVRFLRKVLGSDFAAGWSEEDSMIVNWEAGGMEAVTEAVPLNNQVSIYGRLDKRSDNPSENIDEKFISGKYIGDALRLVLEDLNSITKGTAVKGLNETTSVTSENVSDILQSHWALVLPFDVNLKYREIVKEACQRLVDISREVAANETLGALAVESQEEYIANVEGSLYWLVPGFADSFRATISTHSLKTIEISNASSIVSDHATKEFGSLYYGAMAGLQYFDNGKM